MNQGRYSVRELSTMLPNGGMFLPKDLTGQDLGIRESSTSSKVGKRLRFPGRILNILLGAEPKELEKVRAQLTSCLQPKSLVGQAALDLIDHVRGLDSGHSSAEEQILVPMLEHVVKSKEHSNRERSVYILRILLEREEVGVKAASKLGAVLSTDQTNNRVKLGWCLVVRKIVEAWSGQGSGDSPLHTAAFAVLVSCIPQLEKLVRLGSVQEENRKVPTRLSTAAADCMLAITKGIAVGTITEPGNIPNEKHDTVQPRKSLITPIETSLDDFRDANSNDVSSIPSTSSRDLFASSERRNMALWQQLDNLVSLVNELHEWSYRSRPLHAKGLERVQKRLRSLAQYRDSLEDQRAREGDISIGAEVLVACWQHYGGLLMVEDKAFYTHPQPILQHWLGALQETEDSNTEEQTRKTQEMRGYALACLALTLGKLDSRRLEKILEEFEPQLLNVLFSQPLLLSDEVLKKQIAVTVLIIKVNWERRKILYTEGRLLNKQLRGGDDTIVDLAVAILRYVLFRQSLSSPNSLTGSSASRLETVVPMLLEMLDTRDTAARAVVLLVAEYFAVNPEAAEFEKLFSRLDAEEIVQRRNALDVLAELLSICTRNADMINSSLSQRIATHLFKRLGDTELTNRVEASALFASLDPSFTLPTLVELIYSPDARVRSAASSGVLSVLKRKTDQCQVIAELLDCVSKIVQEHQTKTGNHRGSGTSGTNNSDASPLDVDRIMRLIPDWAAQVEDWSSIIHLLLKKMFDEPANAVIPRFLTSISSQLAEHAHILFPLLLKKFQDQPQLTEAFISKLSEDDSRQVASHLFERLSPLLVLRVLPLSAFNDISSKELYGGLTSVFAGNGGPDMDRVDCISKHLLNRACGAFEFEDVRKVASEITGRLVPEVILPLITAQLEDATKYQDLLRVKACLYALCTSLVVRAKESVNHSLMVHIRKILSSILLWPCVVEEKGFSEVAKAQHGSIDCLALMICAETQGLKESSSDVQSTGLLGTRSQLEVPEELPTAEKPKSNSPASRPSLEIVEERFSTARSSSTSRPSLAIFEKRSFAEESAEEIDSEPPTIQGSIQLIEKLPESEQLKTRPFARKDVSLLSREITEVEKVKKEFSDKRIRVLDRLAELEEESGDGFEEPQFASEATSDDVPELERNEQPGRRSPGDEMQQIPVKPELRIDELPCLERREEQRKEDILEGVTKRGSKPKVLIEELPDTDLTRNKSVKGRKANDYRFGVLFHVVDCVTGYTGKLPWSSLYGDFEISGFGGVTWKNMLVPTAFRICMANVLISACQKISLGARATFAAKVIPPLTTFVQLRPGGREESEGPSMRCGTSVLVRSMHSVGDLGSKTARQTKFSRKFLSGLLRSCKRKAWRKSNDSKLKAACLQVLFTAVYHLKASAVVFFASDLMVLSIETVKGRGPLEERMGGAKLLASLLASEDVLVQELAPHLLDARVALSSISAIDSSPEIRALCEKLLSCLSVPGDDGE